MAEDESDDDEDEEPLGSSLVDYAMIADVKPVTMKEALSGPDEEEWCELMLVEVRQCEEESVEGDEMRRCSHECKHCGHKICLSGQTERNWRAWKG